MTKTVRIVESIVQQVDERLRSVWGELTSALIRGNKTSSIRNWRRRRMANRVNVRIAPPVVWHCCLVLAAAVTLTACATSHNRNYSAKAIEAWVVDDQTGQPLGGVVVVANWLLMRGTIGGRSQLGPFMVVETVSDANGKFGFPAWGPLRNDTEGFLDHEDPQLTFFKPGYLLTFLSNDNRSDYRAKPATRISDWNGKTIRLRRFSGADEKYAEHLAYVGSAAASNLQWEQGCNINRAPMLASGLDRENTLMESRGLGRGGFTFHRLLPEFRAKCGIGSAGVTP